jgi:hypothetical protein
VRRRCAQHGGAFRGDFVRKAAAVRVRRLVRSGQNGASFAYAPSASGQAPVSIAVDGSNVYWSTNSSSVGGSGTIMKLAK